MEELPQRIAQRPLQFIWILDCSGSMEIDGKIQSLNAAIKEAIPEMCQVAEANEHAEFLVRAIKFSDGAQWHVSQPTKVADLEWQPLEKAAGVTDMGKAFSMVAEQLSEDKMPSRGLPPVLVLVSDGQPTDDYSKGLKELLGENWGKKAVRIAIGIGEDADHEVLKKFIDNPELPVLQANNSSQLTRYIRWASTQAVTAASKPASKVKASSQEGEGNLVPAPEDAGQEPGKWVF